MSPSLSLALFLSLSLYFFTLRLNQILISDLWSNETTPTHEAIKKFFIRYLTLVVAFSVGKTLRITFTTIAKFIIAFL